MRPIPKKLLIHSAELKKVSTDNPWQEEQTETIAKLERIRIEPFSKLVTSKDNRQITLSAVLIYDCRISRPKNQTFSQGQKIIFNGIEHVIETIEPLYDGGKLHHYELGLI
ncbi:MAG: putative minor capsid protein [Porcipelethomonas sp.]